MKQSQNNIFPLIILIFALKKYWFLTSEFTLNGDSSTPKYTSYWYSKTKFLFVVGMGVPGPWYQPTAPNFFLLCRARDSTECIRFIPTTWIYLTSLVFLLSFLFKNKYTNIPLEWFSPFATFKNLVLKDSLCYTGMPLRAVSRSTCYSWVCLIFSWWYGWNCLLFIEFSQSDNPVTLHEARGETEQN